jgi:hypothetical protein
MAAHFVFSTVRLVFVGENSDLSLGVARETLLVCNSCGWNGMDGIVVRRSRSGALKPMGILSVMYVHEVACSVNDNDDDDGDHVEDDGRRQTLTATTNDDKRTR